MKVYLDIIFIINFFIDFLLLFGTGTILKRIISLKRILLGSIIGALSLILLFLNMNTLELFMFKIIISTLMILITYGKKNFKKNVMYFYMLSTILGGSLYMFDITFTYKNTGLIFVKNSYFLNFILILVATPIIITLYIKEHKNTKLTLAHKYIIEIYINETKYSLEAILDTGNNLKDPYKHRPIILIDITLKNHHKKYIYVPYKALNTEGTIKCIKPDKIIIDNKEFQNCLIGLSTDKFSLNGVSCILPNKFKEDLC